MWGRAYRRRGRLPRARSTGIAHPPANAALATPMTAFRTLSASGDRLRARLVGLGAPRRAAVRVSEDGVALNESRPRMELRVVACENVVAEIRCGVPPHGVNMVDVSLRVVVLGE